MSFATIAPAEIAVTEDQIIQLLGQNLCNQSLKQRCKSPCNSDYENCILEYTQEGNMGHDTLQF